MSDSTEKTTTGEQLLQFVTFTLNNEEYAVDILNVQEINRIAEITPAPNAPDHVEGVINLRGKVIPVINLRKKFGLEDKKRDETSRIIIIEIQEITNGLIVDAVSEVLRIPSSLIEAAPPMSSDIHANYIKGIAKLDGRLIILLDMNQLAGDTTST
ncbi:MAG: chemotaxis protein CheW [Nitrospira sp.]|nr:chemotaxis protein CheW [Candidatus Brocadiales bacterium]MBL7048071.1 chemotaxis protein CheW [Nitrospira sp.]